MPLFLLFAWRHMVVFKLPNGLLWRRVRRVKSCVKQADGSFQIEHLHGRTGDLPAGTAVLCGRHVARK